MSNLLKRWLRDEKGITGLETAIILIAFVVVASVFAYTVLSAGLFSTQKSQEAVYSGIKEAESTLEMRGSVIAYKGDGTIASSIGKVEITVSTAQGNQVVDLTPNYLLAAGSLSASNLDSVTAISFSDSEVTLANCSWTLSWIGKHTDDYILEAGEKAVITIWLHDYQASAWQAGNAAHFLNTFNVLTDRTFTLEVKPQNGATLNIQRTTPSYLDTVIDLY